MENGFVKIGVNSPKVQLADVEFNTQNIKNVIKQAKTAGVNALVLPELCITAGSLADLFYSSPLLQSAKNALREIAIYTTDYIGIVFVGLPFSEGSKIYNVCAVINKGKVIGIVPKTSVNFKGDVNNGRFSSFSGYKTIDFFGEKVPFGQMLFVDQNNADFVVGVEFATDLYSPQSQSLKYSLAGATVNVCLGLVPVTVGKKEFNVEYIKAHSYRSLCAYAYCEGGVGDTTGDTVFAGHNVICENSSLLAQSNLFESALTVTDIDLDYIKYMRNKSGEWNGAQPEQFERVYFESDNLGKDLTRVFSQYPFLPEDKDFDKRSELILDIQAEGLKKRIEHTHSGSVVLGLSGGLDSTLAILVAVKAIKKAGRSVKDVVAVTMPCFGTTGRTFNNTILLAKALGVTLKKVDISKAVTRHLKDIEHQDGVLDVTFENAQARERTQVLMDIANMNNGLVIGTGDLSEQALGWATYNGDHMSMFSVNGALPKTLIRIIVESYAKKSKAKLKKVLLDILDTPVSPELLPADKGEISQKTEDIVGPYQLHDFFLYSIVRRGWSPKKVYAVAQNTFKGVFDNKTISKWLKIFVRRFFIQQFKRTCQPDGVKVGSVGLNPRGEWFMPSDAVSKVWLDQLSDI